MGRKGRRPGGAGGNGGNVDPAHGRVTFTEARNRENRTIRLTDRAQKVPKGIGPKDPAPVLT